MSKIKFYGPLASALGYIIHAANSNRQKKLSKQFNVYRGLKMNHAEIYDKYEEGREINLLGFTSSTLDKSMALTFAFDQNNIETDDPNKSPVLINIEFVGKSPYFFLNSNDYSAFSEEQEVLL